MNVEFVDAISKFRSVTRSVTVDLQIVRNTQPAVRLSCSLVPYFTRPTKDLLSASTRLQLKKYLHNQKSSKFHSTNIKLHISKIRASAAFGYILQEENIYAIEADFSGMTSVPNFVKFVQELRARTRIAESFILP